MLPPQAWRVPANQQRQAADVRQGTGSTINAGEHPGQTPKLNTKGLVYACHPELILYSRSRKRVGGFQEDSAEVVQRETYCPHPLSQRGNQVPGRDLKFLPRASYGPRDERAAEIESGLVTAFLKHFFECVARLFRAHIICCKIQSRCFNI